MHACVRAYAKELATARGACSCPVHVWRVSEDASRRERIKRFISMGPDDAMQPAASVVKLS